MLVGVTHMFGWEDWGGGGHDAGWICVCKTGKIGEGTDIMHFSFEFYDKA